jgi:hypothetical protein
MDSGEATGSGASEKAQQHGFGLIIASVGGGNTIEPMDGGSALKESVTGAASGGFEREMAQGGEGGYILRRNGRLKRKSRGEFAHKALVGLGIRAAKMVVEVEHKEHHAKAGGKFGKASQQSYGVRASADGHADAFAGADEVVVAQVELERFQHRNIIAEVQGASCAGWETGR